MLFQAVRPPPPPMSEGLCCVSTPTFKPRRPHPSVEGEGRAAEHLREPTQKTTQSHVPTVCLGVCVFHSHMHRP